MSSLQSLPDVTLIYWCSDHVAYDQASKEPSDSAPACMWVLTWGNISEEVVLLGSYKQRQILLNYPMGNAQLPYIPSLVRHKGDMIVPAACDLKDPYDYTFSFRRCSRRSTVADLQLFVISKRKLEVNGTELKGSCRYLNGRKAGAVWDCWEAQVEDNAKATPHYASSIIMFICSDWILGTKAANWFGTFPRSLPDGN